MQDALVNEQNQRVTQSRQRVLEEINVLFCKAFGVLGPPSSRPFDIRR